MERQRNCQCDTLAKDSVTWYTTERQQRHEHIQQLLPKESAGIFVRGEKITSDPTNALRYLLGKERAKTFLCAEQGWLEEQFDEVGWDWFTKS